MAKTVQIRGVPEDVHAELRRRAASAGTSLSDYLLEEVRRVASRPPIADVLRRADSRVGGTSTDEILTVLREVRES